jgi:hypothetical protein
MAQLLAQGAELPPLGLIVLVGMACVGAPIFGLLISAGLGRRPAAWRWWVAAVYLGFAVTSFAMSNDDATPGEAGYVPAVASCALLPVGLLLGAAGADPARRDGGDR